MNLDKKKKIILLATSPILVLLVFVLFFAVRPAAAPEVMTVRINNQTIEAEIASTPAEHYRGLSGRDYLCPDCGMIFIFSDNQEHNFVMREMNFSLDIIFIAKGRIIKIAENLPPAGKNPIEVYKSEAPVDQVLELNAAYASEHGLKIGDRVLLETNN